MPLIILHCRALGGLLLSPDIQTSPEWHRVYVDLLLQGNKECLEAAGNNSVTQYSEKEFKNHTVSMIFS